DSGTFAIRQGSLDNPNYAITFVDGTLEITQRPITVTADSRSKVYGDADPVLSYTITSGRLVGDDTLSGSLPRDPGEDVGTYAIRQGSLNNPNYAITFADGTLTITQRPITVTASSPSKVYGDADPALTYTITSGKLVGDDTLSGSLSRDPGEDVGTYAIRQGSLNNPNYAITFVGGTLTITQRPITVTASSPSKVYGDADPALTYTITSGRLVGDDTLSGSLTRDPGEDVGTYAIRQGSLNNPNYAITFVGGTLTITQRPITVTASSPSKVYGDADPALTYTITSGRLVGDDTLSGSLTRDPGEDVGTYVFRQGSLNNPNYAITFVGGTLTITQRPITVTASSPSKVYGDADPALTYTITSGRLVGDDTLSGSLTRDPGEDVGTYVFRQGSLNNPNYAITFVGGTLTITQRPITVTASSPSKVYGDADPALTYTITSGRLVGDDTLSGSLTRDPGEDVGTYVFRQGSLNNPNYAITFVGGTLTITQRPITVTASSPSKVYGDADPALTYTITSGRLVGDDTLSGSLTRDPGEDVGTYVFRQGSLNNPNYAITFVGGTLTITQRPITVTASSPSKVYGDADPALTYTITSGRLVGDDTLSGSLTRDPGEDVGTYVFRQGSLNNPNYAITFVGGTLTITQRPITVTASSPSKVYGDADPALTYTITSGRLVGDDTLSGSLTRDPGEDVGTYVFRQGSLNNPNYAITFVDGELTITQRPITVTASSPSKAYGDADPALTYTITSGRLVGDDTLSGSLTRDPGEDVGTYAIRQGSPDNPNYAITFVKGELTITQRSITVTASSPSKVDGDADPALTYTITSGRLVGGGTLSGSLTRDPGEDVGTYAIRRGSPDLPNYAITFVDGTLTITQRPITVTAESRSACGR